MSNARSQSENKKETSPNTEKNFKRVHVKDIKPGAIIVTAYPVSSLEDIWTVFYPRHMATHAMMYTPHHQKVNNVTHATIGKSLSVKSHTLAYMTLRDNDEVHIFNPKDDALGALAVAQIKKWESFGLNYDVKKFRQGKSFSKLAKKPDSIFTLFDPAQALKLVYRRNLPRARVKEKRETESGVTCHGLVMDVYNTAWLAHQLAEQKINISPASVKDSEYVTVKYAKDAKNTDDKIAQRPYFFPKNAPGHPRVYQTQKETYAGTEEYKQHPRGKHPFELLEKDDLAIALKLAQKCPFPCRTKWATATDLYYFLFKSNFFEHAGILDKKSVVLVADEKQRSKKEEQELNAEIATNRSKMA